MKQLVCFLYTVAKSKQLLVVLMTILAQTFFALVRRHLVSLMFLSVWHNKKLFKFLNKVFRRLKRGHLMLRYDN